jgi:hypothetical protein
MATASREFVAPVESAPGARRPSYAHAHWYVLAALAVVVAGFWPSFFQSLDAGNARRNFHGVTATLWYVVLMSQSWLMSRGLVAWHRRVAWSAVVLLPILCASALYNTWALVAQTGAPVPIKSMITLLDVVFIILLVALVILGLRNRRRASSAHKRYMCATALIGFPPALTRFFQHHLANVGFVEALHLSFFVTEAVLVLLIIADWRMRERRWAYPITFAVHVVLQLIMVPVATSDVWLGVVQWIGGAPRA